FRVMVSEIVKRTGGSEFFSLKEHRRSWAKQEQGRDGSKASRVGNLMQTLPAKGIGDLIVILDVIDEIRRMQIKGGGSPNFLLPLIPLPLVKEAPFQTGDQFLRR